MPTEEKMRILSIETSCDETAISVIEALAGDPDGSPRFTVLGNALYSQADTHAAYGGVFPMLAKREHARNIVPLLRSALESAYVEGLERIEDTTSVSEEITAKIKEVLGKEDALADVLLKACATLPKPSINAIAVTSGPGLEPALWVGISFAKALSALWNVEVIPVNHMEGHIVSVLLEQDKENNEMAELKTPVVFPALALLISGGHTEIVKINNWHEYEVIGRTRDDAIGEAFDKAARILGLPYPGGPHISRLAATHREKYPIANTATARPYELPRPMIKSPDLDFSFSGIKTAVLYLVKNLTNDGSIQLTEDQKESIACEFENAVTEVLIEKVRKAIDETGAETLIIGGGVVANTYIRDQFQKLLTDNFPHVTLRVPSIDLSTDNSVMIGMAGYLRLLYNEKNGLEKTHASDIVAKGNLSL